MATGTSPRLRALARRSPTEPGAEAQGAPVEQCDLCGQPVPPEHRHVLDIESRELKCCCQACRLLLDHSAAGGGHFRLVPDRRLRIDDFELDDAGWDSLRIPVEMAFFFHSTSAERVAAFYPSPMGATESLLELRSWTELERANPVLGELTEDVEALLVNRADDKPSHWLVPIDDCYELVGLIRTRWRGLSGGSEVWEEIAHFFERLELRAELVTRGGERAVSAPRAAVAAGGQTSEHEREAAWPAT